MKPDAPHWSLMLETLKSLRQQALNTQMQGGPIPSWAFAEKGQQGAAKELAGPIVASQVQHLVSVPVVSFWEMDSLSLSLSLSLSFSLCMYLFSCLCICS
jgi:hypothetical protein